MRRLVLLPPILRVASDRRRLDERLERFEERLRLLERLDERDDGMAYILNAENNSATRASGADREIMMPRSYTEQAPNIGHCHTLHKVKFG